MGMTARPGKIDTMQETQSTSDICDVCGKKKVRGSITQWIFSTDNCSCAAPEKQGILQLCPLCGCRQRTSSGSITQWIFAPVQCKCEARHAPLEEKQLPPADIIEGEPYEFIGVAGVGGVGTVYKATSKKLAKAVAIKAINPSLNEAFDAQKFEREAKSISKLQHPNVLSILDFGSTRDGRPYLVTEWIEGCTLAQYISQHGVLSPRAAEEVFSAVCDGLTHAHNRHIVHRDIKPGNIMLSRSEAGWTVKVIDFGTSKDTAQDQSTTRIEDIAFSPFYVSPERISGINVDERADLYSLGCTMFEALTGRPPFTGKAMTVAMRHQTEAPPTLADVSKGIGFPQHLENVVAKLLAKEPENRYQNAAQVKAALLARDKPVTAKNRRPWFAYAIGSTLIIGAIGALTYLAILAPTDNLNEKKPEKLSKSEILDRSHVLKTPILTDREANSGTHGDAVFSRDSRRQTDTTKTTSTVTNEPTSPDSNNEKSPSGNFFNAPEWLDLKWEGGRIWKIPAVSIVDDEEIIRVARRPDFTYVSLIGHDDKAFSAKALLTLCQQPQLRGLALAETKLTPEKLAIVVKHGHNLRALTIGDNPKLTDKDLEGLTNLKQLRGLDMSYSQTFTDNCIDTLCQLDAMEHLKIGSLTKFTGAKLAKLRRLKNLISLSVNLDPLSEDGWRQLSTLKQITMLNVDGTNLDDAKVQLLLKLPLQRLSIVGTKISDKGLLALAGLKRSLTLLHIQNLQVSKNAIQQLKEEMPNCTIRTGRLDEAHGDLLLAEPPPGRESP